VDAISEKVRRFVEGNIESLEQLEILRVLAEDPGREWNSAALAGEVQTHPHAVPLHLTVLSERGLLTVTRRGTDLVCRYGPQTADLEDLVQQLLQSYKERPVTMIKVVSSRVSNPPRGFASAFRMGKGG
jgi:hypothetical protein